MNTLQILDELIHRYPELSTSKSDIEKTFQIICNCFENGGKLLVCGNGGSASDANHMVGELIKSFSKKRPLTANIKNRLKSVSQERGEFLAAKLESALPAISLTSNNALITAISNDTNFSLIFAQQVLAYGKKGDVLLGISTSGNAENVCNAVITAKSLDLKTIGLTAGTGGELKNMCDQSICVTAKNTHFAQELHLPVYHALCRMLEEYFY